MEQPQYPPVKIVNETDFDVTGGIVAYQGTTCPPDSFRVSKKSTWQSSQSRGLCLVAKISAEVLSAKGKTESASPYSVSGSSYSHFVITEDNAGGTRFSVNRVS